MIHLDLCISYTFEYVSLLLKHWENSRVFALKFRCKYWLLREHGDTELRHLAGPLNHRHSDSSVVIRADRKLLFLLINHSEYSPGNYFLFPACADVPSSLCSPQSPQPGAAEISSGERNSAQQG